MIKIIIITLLYTLSAYSEPTINPTLKVKDKALWELGLLGGIIKVPHYSGSNQYQTRTLVFPNFRYRGKLFRHDENEGTRARITQSEFYKLGLSFGLKFNSSSSNNEARVNMPDLNYTLEIGPRIKILLNKETKSQPLIEFLLPLRSVIETDFSFFKNRGYTFNPGIQLNKSQFLYSKGHLYMRFNALFASKDYHHYYYGVDTQYNTTNRPTYQAKSGYNGYRIFTGYSVTIGKVQSFLGASYYNYKGSDNITSPLFKTKENFTIIFGLGWLFWESKNKGYK